ncbi:hypothetical protein SAMN00790413_06438 [Deinococcus hopiensis KR-140]|uniref:His Kinase A (Phospho-acceptor) domain-containing protein n=1 Tax=Deinococcus hopiensis KR-140 TaxID=695939 RepID=A0A1W1VVV5_9DEIO|nr:hypothetical protein SAMN00790413_06438 [Deinococcus hopiensis KR-140]
MDSRWPHACSPDPNHRRHAHGHAAIAHPPQNSPNAFDRCSRASKRTSPKQRRFAATASHERRTPLAITRTLLGVARHGPNCDAGELVNRLHAVNTRAAPPGAAGHGLLAPGDRREPLGREQRAQRAAATVSRPRAGGATPTLLAAQGGDRRITLRWSRTPNDGCGRRTASLPVHAPPCSPRTTQEAPVVRGEQGGAEPSGPSDAPGEPCGRELQVGTSPVERGEERRPPGLRLDVKEPRRLWRAVALGDRTSTPAGRCIPTPPRPRLARPFQRLPPPS